MDFTTEIQRLQKLSCIALSPEEEKKLWKQLEGIIDFLGKLPDSKMTNDQWLMTNDGRLTLRTIAGVKENAESKKLLQNVKHPIINNSIVIKSVLS